MPFDSWIILLYFHQISTNILSGVFISVDKNLQCLGHWQPISFCSIQRLTLITRWYLVCESFIWSQFLIRYHYFKVQTSLYSWMYTYLKFQVINANTQSWEKNWLKKTLFGVPIWSICDNGMEESLAYSFNISLSASRFLKIAEGEFKKSFFSLWVNR